MLSAGVQGVSAGSQVNRYVTRPTLSEVFILFFLSVPSQPTVLWGSAFQVILSQLV